MAAHGGGDTWVEEGALLARPNLTTTVLRERAKIACHKLPWNGIKLGGDSPGPGAPTPRHDRALLSGPYPGCARRAGESFLPVLNLVLCRKIGKTPRN
jgi:hypothetical protein